MTANKQPGSPSSDIDTFLTRAQQLPRRINSAPVSAGRMIFALDATASRQPGWDRACQLQNRMFLAADQLGGLQLQLCYYRGFNELVCGPWVSGASDLLAQMSGVRCAGGYTQIERVLDHCLATHRQRPAQAVVLIGDAIEETVDRLCGKAGQLGMLGLPLLVFQEGHDPAVRQCFQQMARLSGGAYASFDETSADLLAQLLTAAATFAAGGCEALQRLQSDGARHLLHQLRK